jgi:hypothetical protein
MNNDNSDEFIDSNLNSLSDEYLHENYLKILKFAFPGEAIKEWVKNDIQHHGSYHIDIDWIFPVVQKIESLSTRPVPIDFLIGNGLVEVKVYESIVHTGRFFFLHKDVYANKFQDKTFAIYKGVVAFIDWFNSSIHNEVFKTSPYVSPYALTSNSKVTKPRMFPDKMAIDHLKSVLATAFDTTVEKINSKTRKREVVKARQLAMSILSLDGRSLTETGDIFDKDHATVLHGKKAILNIIDTQDKLYYAPVMEVLEKFDLVNQFKTEAL